jgi:hypothetical protein
MKKNPREARRELQLAGGKGFVFHISRELKLLSSVRVCLFVCLSVGLIFTLAQKSGVSGWSVLVGDGGGVGHAAHEQHDAAAVVPDEEQERVVHLEVLVAKRAYPLQAGGRCGRPVGAALSHFQHSP